MGEYLAVRMEFLGSSNRGSDPPGSPMKTMRELESTSSRCEAARRSVSVRERWRT